MTKTTPIPTEINLRQQSHIVEITFDDGEHFEFTYEYLRVYSPSAEVRGHAPGQEVLQVGKADINLDKIESVGTYAVRFYFDDGHDTGIYSWDWLHYLGKNQDKLWQAYLDKLATAGQKRSPTEIN